MNDHRAARRFAAGFALLFTPVFAVPLLLDPYRWAKMFGWKPEPETDVGLYFGRCLGALAVPLCAQGLQVARDPVAHRSWFSFIEFCGWLLSAVHLRGMLEENKRLRAENAQLREELALAHGRVRELEHQVPVGRRR